MEENNEMMMVENEEETQETTGADLTGLVLGLGALGVAAIGGIIYKNRAKFEARKIKRLEKKGYVIYPPVVEVETDDDEDSDEE